MVLIAWSLNLQLPVEPVHITIKIVSSNPVHSEVYSIQHYVIKFVSDLQQIYGFLQVASTNKTDCHYIIEILLIVALNTTHLSNIK